MDSIDNYILDSYDIIHKYPHIKISSVPDLIRHLRKLNSIPAIYWNSPHLSLNIVEKLARYGVFIIKMGPKNYRKFAYYLHYKKGFRLIIGNDGLLLRQIELKTRYGVVYILQHRGRQRKYTSQIISLVLSLAMSGATLEEIQREVAVISLMTVRRILKRHNISLKRGRKPFNDTLRVKIVDMWLDGMKYRQIAKEVGVSLGFISKVIHEYIQDKESFPH